MERKLKGGVLGIREMVANNIAESAVAIASIFVLAGMANSAGVGTPFVVLMACIGFFCHVNTTAEFSRVIPSAGFYSTYCARTFGPLTGATIAGVYLIGMYVFYMATFVQVGLWTATSVSESLGFSLAWWIPALILEALVVALLLRGIKFSVGAAISLFTVEVVLLFICAFGILWTSPAYISVAGFNPANIKNGTSGFSLAFILGIFLFLGASGSSPLAEEARNPRRSLPRAIFTATSVAALIYIFISWVMVVGLHNDSEAITSASFPLLAATKSSIPGFQYLLYFAGFTSAIGVLFGSQHAGSRVMYNTASDGLAPTFMGRVHSKWQTPWPAIVIPVVVTMAGTLVLGNIVGAHKAFDYTATYATDMFMIVFIVTNVATIPYFWRHQRKQFSWIRHCIIPLLGVVAFGYPLYASVLPSQEPPYGWFWLIILIGIVLSVLWGLVRRHKSEVGARLAVDD